MIEDAVTFAAQAHAGQTDRLDAPYIYHALRVLIGVREAGGSEVESVAAVLHDVVEDTDTTLDEIEELFGPQVAVLVDAVSRREGESYENYMARLVTAGASAIRIKRADLADNSNPQRLAQLPPETRRELEAKYAIGYAAIERAEQTGES